MYVVYIDIDSLRPDHMSCYGYGRPTTPHIDHLAEQGTRFTHCFTSDSPCMPSRAALVSGTFGITNGVVTHGERGLLLHGQQETLPNVLRQHSIPAVAISSFGRHPSPWFYVGWHELIDPSGRANLHFLYGSGFQQVTGEEVITLAIEWLNAHRHLKNFYLYVQLWDPHTLYEAPLSFVEAVRNNHYPKHPTPEEIETHQQNRVWHSAPAMGITGYDEWRKLIDEYDGEIRYADYQVGRLLDAFKALGLYDETFFLLAADHGEEMGEHGFYAEHGNIYNGTQHIPLIVRHPQAKHQGVVSHKLVYQLDIAATVCDAFGITPPPHWDSHSLLDPQHHRPYLVCGHGLYTAQRGIVTRDWKFIRTFEAGLWNIPAVQLFRMEDPWEQTDLASTFPEQVGHFDTLLRQWENEHRVYPDPLMLNAAQGPAGLIGARKWTDQFQKDGKTMPFLLGQRKPEPQ
ncbi:MAG TPA: sulfatase [Ktedonobacteraceae bacterium]|nr:sulfatase [Ktedonobacteraceae bacterium]